MEEKQRRAKRPKTLLVIGKDGDWATGGLANESLNDYAAALISDLQNEFSSDLGEWFRNELALYREVTDDSKKNPTPREELELVRDAQKYLLETMQRLENLPPITSGWIDGASYKKNGRMFHTDRLPGFGAMVNEFNSLLEIMEQKLEQLPSKPGRTTESDRDALLSDTADWLLKHSLVTITKAKAAETAGKILTTANIPVPASVIEIERRISKHKKGLNSP